MAGVQGGLGLGSLLKIIHLLLWAFKVTSVFFSFID